MNQHSAVKMAGATLAFALFHSMLASRTVKKAAAKRFGQANCNAGYRILYVGQSLVTFLMLVNYGARLPSYTLYRATGMPAILLRCGQIAGLVHLYTAAAQVGVKRLAGISNLHDWLQGRQGLRPPVAQGPELNEAGRLTTSGPYTWSRHPLNWSGIPVFWLTPHMTTKRLAFNLVSTAYFVLGSQHEAIRLRKAYGEHYREYEKSDVPFYWPRRPLVKNRASNTAFKSS
jgi:protein-S-isoprenylcysteine O-methyltransferase Ste14